MEPTLPTIEDLHDRLAQITLANYGDDGPSYFEVYRIHAQAMLLIALELEQINNNLEALRGDHKGQIGWYDKNHVWHDGLKPLEVTGDD